MSEPRPTDLDDLPVGFPVPDHRRGEWPPATPMVGHHVRLERLRPEHAAALHEAFSLDPTGRLWTYLQYGPFRDAAAYERWVRSVVDGDDPLFLAVVDLRTERPVGVTSFLRVDRQHRTVEVGHVAFSPLLQRTPGATETITLMAGTVFDELGYRRFEWKCDDLNQRSRSAARRLGFEPEGVWRQAMVYKGRNRDTAWFAMIDRDWPALQAAHRRWLDPGNFDAEGRQRAALSDLVRRAAQDRAPAPG